ncbi:MAG TPA: lysophospholipid acyltransferase family protein [Puia sp.]|jgi:1-acyl-sn-glycerol-3-phosphate acyltransferase|nr:lysophospholipid acyltransferase family protein [Puia sp.]
MRQLTKPFWWLYCLYAFLLFLIGMFCVLPFVAVYSLQDEKTGGDRIYKVCRYWDNAWLKLVGIRHINIYESTPDPGKRYVFVSNHISYLDIPLILQAVRRNGFRILGKAEMTKFPVFGYIYSRAVILVDRTTAMGRSRSVRQLKSMLAIDRSVFIFPEGTFNETGRPLKFFYDGAFRIAIETQTPLQPILFVDTFDRLHYSSLFSLRPGITRAIFLPEVDVEGLTVADLPLLKQRVFSLMEEGLIRHRVSWILS